MGGTLSEVLAGISAKEKMTVVLILARCCPCFLYWQSVGIGSGEARRVPGRRPLNMWGEI